MNIHDLGVQEEGGVPHRENMQTLTPVLVVTLAFLAFSPMLDTICWTDIYMKRFRDKMTKMKTLLRETNRGNIAYRC